MGFQWYGTAAKADLEKRVGQALVQAATMVQSELTTALSTSFPPASKVGEFAHGRTWNLRSSVMYEPHSPAEAGRLGRVRVGYAAKAPYGAILELRRGRLGLKTIVERLKGRLAALGLVARTPTGGAGG